MANAQAAVAPESFPWATSAGAHGIFAGSPSCVGIASGFSSPLAREVLGEADLVLGFGAALNHWTTDSGRLIAAETPVVQVDLEASALGMLRCTDADPNRVACAFGPRRGTSHIPVTTAGVRRR